MANKQGLIDYLLKHGKNQSWSELASRFGFTNHDNARKCWSKHKRSLVLGSSGSISSVPGAEHEYLTYGKLDSYKSSAVPGTYGSSYVFSSPTYTYTTNPTITKDEVLTEIRNIVKVESAVDIAQKFIDFKQSLRSGITAPTHLLELALFDAHIGKLSHESETGDEYNTSIALKRYKDAIRGLLAHVNVNNIDRILLPIGNDLVHVDNKKHTTFNGTPQDCDSRYIEMVKATKTLLIDTINDLSLLAPVDVIMVHGNHDTHTTFLLGEVLSAYYHDSPLVNINNDPTQRKYYSYGSTAIQFTHGNEERHSDLGLIFATEKPHMWGLSKYRFCQLGHFHKNKRTSYLSIDDQTGFTVQILPSLSGSDAWHLSKGYLPRKQAKAFLFSKDSGLVAEYTYNG